MCILQFEGGLCFCLLGKSFPIWLLYDSIPGFLSGLWDLTDWLHSWKTAASITRSLKPSFPSSLCEYQKQTSAHLPFDRYGFRWQFQWNEILLKILLYPSPASFLSLRQFLTWEDIPMFFRWMMATYLLPRTENIKQLQRELTQPQKSNFMWIWNIQRCTELFSHITFPRLLLLAWRGVS